MNFRFPALWIVLVFSPFILAAQSTEQWSAARFKNPTNTTKLHTWWHWMEGSISKVGITKDLESMHSNGIVQATILNVGLFDGKTFDVPKVAFNSKEWHSMFAWALKEANRLNIKIGAHNCDGWNSSGGPWIKPAQSMKTISWSKTVLTGNRLVDEKIAKPFFRENFYEDIAVLAIPFTKTVSNFKRASPVFKLNDSIFLNGLSDGSGTGGPVLKWGDTLTIELSQPIAVNRIALQAYKSFTWQDVTLIKSKFSLYYSNDGINYEWLDSIPLNGVNKQFEIPIKPITAKYFKLAFAEPPWTDPWYPIALAELELLSDHEKTFLNTSLPFLLEKSVDSRVSSTSLYNIHDTVSVENIPLNKIIDITHQLDEHGVLHWKAPAGDWQIFRIGYTTTAYKNTPATKEGEGLECDKLDSNAVNFHFSQFPQKLINTAGKYVGNTFKFLLIDSWECAFQNWTKNFAQEFQQRMGYSLVSFLPVLCGVTIENTATSEAFLYDYRKTIAALIEENYYQFFAKLCKKNKLEMHAEVIYGNAGYPPLDVLKSNKYADMPMFEFWTGANANTGFMEYKAQQNQQLDFPASAALFYRKKVLGAEAYTSMANYSESPWDLKPYGDRAYTTGINQLILHSYTHQPSERFPGMTLGPYGSHFNRHIPWFAYLSSWNEYHARIQLMLQQGQMQADILHFVGDQFPQFVFSSAATNLPTGYQMHICNADILKNKLKVKAGKLVFDQVKFSVLTLPENSSMELATLQNIAALVKQGAVVYGEKPIGTLSMKAIKTDARAFNQLVTELWGAIDGKTITENSFGKGKICWGMPLPQLLKQLNIQPDFTSNLSDSAEFLYTHRVLKQSDIFFVFNQTNQALQRVVTFKTNRSSIQLLDPVSGAYSFISASTQANGLVSFPILFKPRESKIFVFDNNKPSGIQNSMTVKPVELPIKLNHIQIDFDTKGYHKIPSIQTPILGSLTEFEQSQVKYFSGLAQYTIQFSVEASGIHTNGKTYLNIGKFGGTASVILNGNKVGTVWNDQMELDISGKLHPQNILIITVGNEYRNRIIGDLKEYGTLKHISTSLDIKNVLRANMPLKPSGLLGPLRITHF